MKKTVKKEQTREIAVISLLTAFCVVGRLITVGIPNVQPVTAILLLLTLYTKPKIPLLVGSLSILITNLYLGTGIWTIAQMLTYSLLILLIIGIKKVGLIENISSQLILCVMMSMSYGLLISWMLRPFFGIQAFWPYYLSGISFDVLHSLGTVIFFLLLRQPIIALIKRYGLME